jgi:DNA mismatch endonuclease, patch repair protein
VKTDIWNKTKRSEVMGLIRSHGNKSTELRMILVFKQGEITGWRRKQRLTGKPDFVFRKERICVFVDGCFWHGCPKHGTWPRQNAQFWRAKLLGNQARDRVVNRELKAKGWKVIRVWEHSLKKPGPVIARIRRALTRISAQT